MPATRRDFWLDKFEKNRARDREDLKKLRAAGWDILVIWECQTRDLLLLTDRCERFLGPSGGAG